MPQPSPAYLAGQQLIMEGQYLRGIGHFLALAQADPQQAADAYERIACCYFNLDNRLTHLPFALSDLGISGRPTGDKAVWRQMIDSARRLYRLDAPDNTRAAWLVLTSG
jgi:hypothetical protein